MQQRRFAVLENRAAAKDTFLMRLGGPAGITAPGQFVNLQLPGRYLRRPISVCDWTENSLTLAYKVVGGGTADLAALAPGAELDLLTGLGTGFDPACSGDRPLLVGGGIGAAPLVGLARCLRERGVRPVAVLGFNTAEEVFCRALFEDLDVELRFTTADGSLGTRGLVTDALPEDATYLYTCGPMPMLRALSARCTLPGEYSLEARMGCGFGACMGCTIETAAGPKRVCREGPVFRREELLW